MSKSLQTPSDYADLLAEIKTRVRTAQVRAAFAVSRELILLYWSIGRDILNRQQSEGWGTKVIERLAKDLGTEFPGVEGFSSRNLKYMRSFAEAWPEAEIVPQLVALLPWGHLRVLLDRLKERETREWYAGKLNFYLSAADDLLRTAPDAPTLGLILCENRGESIVAEYALRDIAKPIGVSTYRVTRQLPEPLRDEVPSIEDLKQVVEKLLPKMSELQAEQRSEHSSLRKPSGKSARKQ